MSRCLAVLLQLLVQSMALHAPPAQVEQRALVAVVDQHKLAMKVCYLRVSQHDPTLRLKVVTRLRIDRAGRVTSVGFTDPSLAREEVGQCLSEAIMQWTFPVARTEYGFEFPIVMMRD